MNRLHPIYQNVARQLINDDGNIVDVYEKHARSAGVYDEDFFNAAIVIAETLKNQPNARQLKAITKCMTTWPVFYNIVVCKQVPTRVLAGIIEKESFRPIAEELMTVIFGV